MLVRFAGSGDAFGSGGRFQACLWVEGTEGAPQVTLVDCGASSLVALRRLGLDPSRVAAVVLSHLHGDHFAGLPFLILDAQFAKRTDPLVVAGPPGVGERVVGCMENLFPGSSTARRSFATRFVELPPDLTPVQVGDAAVAGVEVSHASGAPPLALRVTLDGRTLAYSGDTEWTDALIEAADGADLFVCEAYHYDKRVPHHLDYGTLRTHLARLRAGRVLLTHMSPGMLDRLGDVDLPAAHDGMVVEV